MIRRIIKRMIHMSRTRSECWHVCLWCEYYDTCRKEMKENEFKVCDEKRRHGADTSD